MSFSAEEIRKQAVAAKQKRGEAQAADEQDSGDFERKKGAIAQRDAVIANIDAAVRKRERVSHQCTVTLTAEQHENLKANARLLKVTLRDLMLTALGPFLEPPTP